MAPRRDLLEIYQSALNAVRGDIVVAKALREVSLASPVYLLSLGKCACAMARGVLDVLGDAIVDGLIVTKYGAAESLPWRVIEAGHPLPDDASLFAGEQTLAFIDRIPTDATVLVLLSGGTSALLESLPAGVTLADLRALNEWLLGAGLDIHAMNTIRKRVSCIKGGRLAQYLAPRAVACLTMSDVVGDEPRSIASGPLTPEPVTALSLPTVPIWLRQLLARTPPMPSPDDSCFTRVRYQIVARNADAVRAAAAAAMQKGYRTCVASLPATGDAMQMGARLADELRAGNVDTVYVWGGETTMVLPSSPGRGGRNQALALAAARRLHGNENIYLLAAGTDGTDGPTDDAGALIDGGTLARGNAHGLDANDALARADAGVFLEASGDLIQTGPTGTNVMDLIIGLRSFQ